MNSIYIIVKNEHGNPKTPVRWGRQGGGALGYCLHDGNIVCFASFEEADRVLETFSKPHWYDIVEYKNTNLYNNERSTNMSTQKARNTAAGIVRDALARLTEWERVQDLRRFDNTREEAARLLDMAQNALDYFEQHYDFPQEANA